MSLADLQSDLVPADLVAPPDAGRQIAARVENARRQVVRTRRVTRGLLVGAAALLLIGVLTLVDYRLELSWNLRLLGLLAVVTAVVLVARRGWPQWSGVYRLEEAAGDVERRLVQLGQRLRTTVDYQEPSRHPARAEPRLIRALEDDTFTRCQDADFAAVVDKRPLLVGVAIATLLAVAWLLALATNAEWRIAAGRVLLLPWQYTTVTFAPHETTIKVGESVEVAAEISGRPLRAASVRFRPLQSGGEWTTLKLAPPAAAGEASGASGAEVAPANGVAAPLAGKVTATLADCQEDLEFEVVGGPVPLPHGRVTVLQPLDLKQFHARAVPPTYTGRPAEEFTQWAFKVLEGTTVSLDIELSRAATEARLTPVKKADDKSNRSTADPAAKDAAAAIELVVAGPSLRADLRDLRTSGVWELTARAADGMELEPQRLAIRVQPDARAKVRFLEPAEELEVIPTAEVPLVVEAADDLALIRVGIAYQVADGPMQTVWQQEFAEGTTDLVRGQTTLSLEDFQVTFQDGVTYYAFADDKYFDQERRTATPMRFIDIRPFKMMYQMLDTGGT